MNANQNTPAAGSSGPLPPPVESLRNLVRDAVRYWEIRRIGYNLVLVAITVAWFMFTWPHFRPAVTWRHGLVMLVLAAIANACYCAAYPVDLALQRSPLRSIWRRYRWTLWCAGVVLAGIFACYWIADEIYPGLG